MEQKLLFKTRVVDSAGVSTYEVYEIEPGKYNCIMVDFNGYLNGHGNIVIERINKKWIAKPDLLLTAQLIDSIKEFTGTHQ